MRLLRDLLLVALSTLLPTWLSTIFPQATIQRTVGVAIVFCLLALLAVVWWESSMGKKSRFRRRGGNPPPAQQGEEDKRGRLFIGNNTFRNVGRAIGIGRGVLDHFKDVEMPGNEITDAKEGIIIEGDEEPK